ncbi:MAG: nucleoside monophosphate kinase [Candidatus Levybacteria bacterium]|nr:nucleoside monophosphate kinase [Candidatus Levybacteria bacterium]
MIIIFIGPPYIGKGTQSKLLGQKLNLPVFSMGALIRQARDEGNQRIAKAFEEYSMKGLHLPIEIKFPLLKERMDKAKSGFILDNFPERQDGLDVFNKYLSENYLSVNKVFLINISDQERLGRMLKKGREGRPDDDPEIVVRRLRVQGEERLPVINYFKEKGILEEINGERHIEEIHQDILNRLGIK